MRLRHEPHATYPGILFRFVIVEGQVDQCSVSEKNSASECDAIWTFSFPRGKQNFRVSRCVNLRISVVRTFHTLHAQQEDLVTVFQSIERPDKDYCARRCV